MYASSSQSLSRPMRDGHYGLGYGGSWASCNIGTVHISMGTIHTDIWHYSHWPAVAEVDMITKQSTDEDNYHHSLPILQQPPHCKRQLSCDNDDMDVKKFKANDQSMK